jgi:transcriptional regulator with XRE-family HTH domain
MENYREINLKDVGARIRKARLGLKLTQEKAAELACISGQFWSLIETGRERGSVDAYWRIADVLGLTLDDLFYDDAAVMRIRRSSSLEGITAECTRYEKTVINEALLALRAILERARGL